MDYSRVDYTYAYKQYRTSVLNISAFKGVDLTNQPAGVSESRTSNGINMIRDVPGKVRKRMGYDIVKNYGARINGIYTYRDHLIVHAGTKLYVDGNQITATVANARSYGVPMQDYLCILDGNKLGVLYLDGTSIKYKTADSDPYIPTCYIAVDPEGGGEELDKPNRLTNFRTETFLDTRGTSGDTRARCTKYQLTFTGLSNDTVKVEQLNSSGSWVNCSISFSVDRTKGIVTFASAPGATPITGEPNIKITYGVDSSEYKNSINKCKFGACYGYGGMPDRVFVSGNPSYANYDYWSDVNNPFFFPDINYGVLGNSDSPITGYSIINKYLATHKLHDDNSRNIYTRLGKQDDDKEITFPIETIIQGEGAVSPYAFGFQLEPMFLTKTGICATTPYTLNNERYIQNRSFYLNGELTKEENLSDAICATYKEFLLLCINKKVYVLDSMQKAYDSGNSRSTNQYEGYVFDNIDAYSMREFNGELYFGDADGRLFKFYTNAGDPRSYSDWSPYGKKAIHARWDIDFDGVYFNKMKRILQIGVRISNFPITSMKMWRLMRGEWKEQFEAQRSMFFDFNYLDFAQFTFNVDAEIKLINKRLNMRRIDTVRFSFRNDELEEPFGLYELLIEASEAGYYKGV